MLSIAVAVLSLFILILAVHTILLQLQLRSINRQLAKRLTEHTRQPVSLELINKGLNALTVNINKCLKAEENFRLDALREEKQFKEMIANISHDLRTPLTAIKGYQQLIAKGALSKDQQAKLQIVQKHADELGSLIEHFFEYTYLLNTEVKPKLERINLVNLAAECLAESVAIFEESSLAVQFDEEKPVLALVDREMAIRIFQNLIRNCAAHSDGNVTVKVMENKKAAIISFSNPVKNADGIDVNRLFERFYTGDHAHSKSTGLGLSIVKLLAEQMDGTVSADLQDHMLEIRVQLPLY